MVTAYLLGAGFSKAISSNMPTMAELGEALALRTRYGMVPGAISGDVESVLTYTSVPQPWLPEPAILRNRAVFEELVVGIVNVLEERTNTAMQEELPLKGWLHTLVAHWHQEQSSIVSLNYDTLLERAACSYDDLVDGSGRLTLQNLYPIPLTPAPMRRIPIVGSEQRSTFRLIKLHGSVNWFYSSRATPGDQIYLGLGSEWTNETARDNWKDDVRDKVPAIIPPTLDKGSYLNHDSLRSLWAQAAEALRNADRVVVMGYSLPDTDLTMRFFMENCSEDWNSKELVVVDKNPDATEHFNHLLGRQFNVQEGVTGEDSIPRFVSSLA